MLIGGLVRAGEGVQMHAAGELGQGGGPVHALHELIHVQTAGQVQGSGKLPVDWVLHDDVHHGTAAVHHGVELVPCLLGRVYTGDAAQQAMEQAHSDYAVMEYYQMFYDGRDIYTKRYQSAANETDPNLAPGTTKIK